MKTLLYAVVCLFALAATGAYASDMNFGATARSSAMGGAGIALGDDSGTTVMLNPAAPAAAGSRFRFIFPGFDLHTTGASIGDLTNSISKVSGGSTDDAISLISDFAKQPTTLTLNTMTGFSGKVGLSVQAQAQAIITPGPETQKWAGVVQTFKTSSLSSFQPQDYAALLNNVDLTAAVANWHVLPLDPVAPNVVDNGTAQTAFTRYLSALSLNTVQANLVYALPAVQLSTGHETKSGGQLWMGTNMQFLHSESHTWNVVGSADSYNYDAANKLTGIDVGFTAVEQTPQKDSAMKADVGFIYRPKGSLFQYGAVVNNLISPKLNGIPNSQEKMMISAGLAIVPKRNLTLAADLVNITGANGEKAQLRMGGEFRLGRMFAARAGYSGSTWTYGAEVLGLNIAWAGRSAQLLSNILKF